MNTQEPEFWRHKSLTEMSPEEWESLCDGCAKCCLNKLEDIESGDIYFTNVHCRLLDTDTCQCTNYPARSELVPDCITLTMKELENPYWLPETCAYRRLALGEDLPEWHPLVTGDPDSVFHARQSIGGRTISEDDADHLESHLIDWIR